MISVDSFDIFRVNKDNIHFDFSLKNVEDRNLVLASRFHADIKAYVFNKPVFKVIEIKVKRRKIFLNILSDMSFLVSDTNGGNNKVLVNIKTSTIKTVDLKHKKTPFKKGEVALTASLRNITIVD